MTILLTLYLAGMPVSFGILAWATWGAPRDAVELDIISILAAFALLAALWPLLLASFIYGIISER